MSNLNDIRQTAGYAYDGPRPGGTPAGEADLHGNGANPFGANGTPPIHLSEPSSYPNGSPQGYYVNPGVGPTANPYSGGVGSYTSGPNGERAASDYIASGLDAAYAHALGNLRGGDEPQPSAGDYWQDQAFGRSGTGRS